MDQFESWGGGGDKRNKTKKSPVWVKEVKTQ